MYMGSGCSGVGFKLRDMGSLSPAFAQPTVSDPTGKLHFLWAVCWCGKRGWVPSLPPPSPPLAPCLNFLQEQWQHSQLVAPASPLPKTKVQVVAGDERRGRSPNHRSIH